jgi:hypothetical protein
MSPTHQFRRLVVGLVAVLALTLLAPVAVTAEEDDTALTSVAAPVAEEPRSAAEWAANRVLAAQRALLTGEIGSMQEERLQAIVAAAPSWDETSGYGSVEASRAAASALRAPVAASSWDETSGYGAVEANRAEMAASGPPAAGTPDEAALLAQFRAVELALSRHLGAEPLEAASCHGGD